MIWKTLPIPPSELSLSRSLRCGQTFRWKNIHDVWTFSTDDRIVLLKESDGHIEYSEIIDKSRPNPKDTLAFLTDYFALDVKLEELYQHWSQQHGPYQKKGESPFKLFPGVRQLRQDPWETIVSFICSANNNVKRISKMCEALCTEYGRYVGSYAGIDYFSFPQPHDLCSPDVDERLRKLGFGYRAKYIQQTAHKFCSDEFPGITMEKLYEMRTEDYETAHAFLLQLSGVGPKVADCICLMALDKTDAIPVDTHVYQIAAKYYNLNSKKELKSMTKEMYAGIRDFFRELFGEFAGWAQTVLFASDLSDLNNGINIKKEEMIKKEIKKEEKEIKMNEKMTEIKKEIKKETKMIKIKKETEVDIEGKVEDGSRRAKRIRVR